MKKINIGKTKNGYFQEKQIKSNELENIHELDWRKSFVKIYLRLNRRIIYLFIGKKEYKAYIEKIILNSYKLKNIVIKDDQDDVKECEENDNCN